MCNSDFDAQSNFPLTSLWAPHLKRMADHNVPVYADVCVCVCVHWLIRSEKQAATAGAPPGPYLSHRCCPLLLVLPPPLKCDKGGES